MTTKLGTGVHALPRDEYDRLGRVNFSTLKWMGKSPAHYLYRLTTPDEKDTAARQRGRVVSMAVYEPARFRENCVVYDGKTRRGKEWDAFLDRHPDHEILTESAYETAIAISKAVRASAQAAPYVSGGKGEQTVLWTHEVPATETLPGYKIDCKGRLDFVANCGAIVDLKNTRDASRTGFGRQVVNYDALAQAAMYVDGFLAATGRELPYVLVAVEAAPPHVPQVYRVHPEQLEIGRERYRGWLDRLHVCLEENDFPGYEREPVDLVLPRWATPDEEDVTALDLVLG